VELEEEDLALARALAAEREPEKVAAALIRALRAPLPAPEEIAETAPPAPLRPRSDGGEGVWFRLSVGRNAGADPRWLLPFICRRGHLTRREVGRIEVGDRETRVEIAPWAAEHFARVSAKPIDGEDDHIRIEPLGRPSAHEPRRGPPPRSGPPRGPRPPRR
jgi:ATP-dependent RNA helicase DeaD